jgi:hypothetical protein
MYRKVRSCREKKSLYNRVKSKEQLVRDPLTGGVVNDAVSTSTKEASELRQDQNYLLPYHLKPRTLVLRLICISEKVGANKKRYERKMISQAKKHINE